MTDEERFKMWGGQILKIHFIWGLKAGAYPQPPLTNWQLKDPGRVGENT